MQSTLDRILKDNKLSLTEVRKKILEADCALVAAKIEQESPGSIDRVTV